MRANLATLLDDFHRGSQNAIVTHRGNRRFSMSWEELAGLSARFAAELEQRGLEPGDRVLIWGANCAEWVASFFGCILRGVVAVPLDAAGSAEFALRIASEVQAKLAVGSHEQIRHFAADSPPVLDFIRFSSSLPPPNFTPVPNLSRSTTLQIVFTSGATADPKGIVHTHGNVLASLDPLEKEIGKYMRYERIFHPLRILHTLPLSHVFGQFMGLWVPPLIGAETHYENRLDAPRLARTIRREHISVLAAPPRVLQVLRAYLLSSMPDLAERLDAARGSKVWKRWWKLRRLHRSLGFKFWALVSGGAAIPPDLENFWRAGGFALIQGYGMTETTALVTINHPFKPVRGSIGKPLPGREIEIGPEGELLVRGGPVAERVWKDGRMERRTEEWLATGDLVTRNREGQLVFAGRKADMIVTAAGLNIYPQDLEQVLRRQPGVRDALAVPYSSPTGPVPAAAFITDPAGDSDTAAKAIDGANRELAQFQQILHWTVWPQGDFPRTSTGKVLRRQVAAWVQQALQTSAANGDASALPILADPLAALLRELAPEHGREPVSDGDRLAEDLHLDSLAMVQLASAVEDRFGADIDEYAWESVRTVGDLRRLIDRGTHVEQYVEQHAAEAVVQRPPSSQENAPAPAPAPPEPASEPAQHAMIHHGDEHRFPRWPWWKPVWAFRVCFLELILLPLVRLLLGPRTPRAEQGGRPRLERPSLLIANHVTFFDPVVVFCGLRGEDRRHVAIAMAGEMLSPWRRAKVMRYRYLTLLAPIAYWLLVSILNVFPLPRGSGLRRSFAHAGEALDHGYHVLVFPEGGRSHDGLLQPFENGIGLLARESQVPVVPIHLDGLGPLKLRQTRWFRPGDIGVRIGRPLIMDQDEDAAAFTRRLEAVMKDLAGQAPSAASSSNR